MVDLFTVSTKLFCVKGSILHDLNGGVLVVT